MSITLAQYRTEIQSRGFDYISNTRIDTLVNYYYHDLCHRYPWPFLETTSSGVAPITISDFGHALSVVDTTAQVPLTWGDLRTLREQDPLLTGSGTPEQWYMDGSAFSVYPVSTSDTISVRYVKVPTDLSADGDITLIPSRFQYILVEGVVSKLFMDDDEYGNAQQARAEYETGIQQMCNELLVPNYDSPTSIAPGGDSNSTDW